MTDVDRRIIKEAVDTVTKAIKEDDSFRAYTAPHVDVIDAFGTLAKQFLCDVNRMADGPIASAFGFNRVNRD
jgi:hypothetical protein